jgi:ribosomal protein S14
MGIGSISGHVKRSGDPKASYPSKEAAKAAEPHKVIYKCSLCGRYHAARSK